MEKIHIPSGITQEDIAEALDMTQSNVSKILLGEAISITADLRRLQIRSFLGEDREVLAKEAEKLWRVPSYDGRE